MAHTTHKVSQDSPGHLIHRLKQEEVRSYSCTVCGGERFQLVLRAEALKNYVGIMIRCGNCNASQNVNNGVGSRTMMKQPSQK